VLLTKHDWKDQVKEDEMGRTCSTNGEKIVHVGYWWESQKKEATRKTKK
jgi:hypothetical protein